MVPVSVFSQSLSVFPCHSGLAIADYLVVNLEWNRNERDKMDCDGRGMAIQSR
jgi:hypothetical protein